MLNVLLKLFSYCVKVKANRLALCNPEADTISIMLRALNLVLPSSALKIALVMSIPTSSDVNVVL